MKSNNYTCKVSRRWNLYVFGFVFWLSACSPRIQKSNEHFEGLLEHLRKKDFYVAMSSLNAQAHLLNEFQKLYIDVILTNAFNRNTESNEGIGKLLTMCNNCPDSVKVELLKIEADNYFKSFDYGSAYRVLNKFSEKNYTGISTEEREELVNLQEMMRILQTSPPQIAEITPKDTIQISLDKAGLKNLSVSYNDKSYRFIYDTGANVSTITASMARELNITPLPGTIQLGTITGQMVESRLGLGQNLKLGKTRLSNVVFLIMDDKALYIEPIDYQINGILGYPVISALERITLTGNQELIVRGEAGSGISFNMALDGLTPLIFVDNMNFTFDTGAESTMLYERYFRAFESDIRASFPSKEVQFGGAGGVISLPAYSYNWKIGTGNESFTLRDIDVLSKKIKPDETAFGNIGQDFTNMFRSYSIDFKAMKIIMDGLKK